MDFKKRGFSRSNTSLSNRWSNRDRSGSWEGSRERMVDYSQRRSRCQCFIENRANLSGEFHLPVGNAVAYYVGLAGIALLPLIGGCRTAIQVPAGWEG